MSNTRVANIGATAHAESKGFIDTLTSMMEIIEKVSDKIPEGDYLELMNSLKDAYGYKGEGNITQVVHHVIYQNPVVQHHERRTRMVVNKERVTKDEAYLLKKGLSVTCELCDCVVSKRGLKEHQHTKKCWKIQQTKKLTKTTQRVTTDNEATLITKLDSARADLKATKVEFKKNINLLKRQKELEFSDEYALEQLRLFKQTACLSPRFTFRAIEYVVRLFDEMMEREERQAQEVCSV
jgi:hypothetical protein